MPNQTMFIQRYRVEDIHIDYQQRIDRIPYNLMSMDQPFHIHYETVKMATVKLPVEELERLVDDLEMKDEEAKIRLYYPAARDAYEKYLMVVSLLK
jgi:hypothetical protein